ANVTSTGIAMRHHRWDGAACGCGAASVVELWLMDSGLLAVRFPAQGAALAPRRLRKVNAFGAAGDPCQDDRRGALPVHLAHAVGEVGAERRARASRTPLTRVPHFVGEVYDDGAYVWLRPSGCAVQDSRRGSGAV